MLIAKVDSERRVAIPEEFHVSPGDTLIVKIVDDHLEIERLEIIPAEEFKNVLEDTNQLYSEAFKRLAKGE